MGDTWGVSGPTFLLLYAVLAVLVLIASIRVRRSIAKSGRSEAVTGIARQPHDVAYLNGGAELAVVSALTALRLRGGIWSERGKAQRVPHADPGSDGLERALYGAIDAPTHRSRIPANRAVAAALAVIEKRLVDAGLLLSDEQRRRIRNVGWWMLAVVGLGLVRLLAGVANAKPVGLLVVALAVVTVIGGVLVMTAPRRTRLGDKTLAALRIDNHALAPKERPDWALYGPPGAALGIGLFGMSAVWASDPAIAGELAVQRISTSGSDGSGGGDSGGGG
ncbi:MAG: TIGR04222 domain-containing membrane protein, partial [Pseudonocardiales bacterium]|nr:TIGR04222 domain-containing membrane protein [Pseudonocardiales bacterium]